MKRAGSLLILLAAALSLSAYDFLTRTGLRWPDGDIPINLQLDETLTPYPMLDGKSSWDAVAQEALGLWNGHLTRVQFTTFANPELADGNGQNDVFFSDNIYGHKFGGLVLAITTAWRVRSERVEADTIFNSAIDWNSYRGSLDFQELDLRRVAAHEFGHTLGLDHPDRVGQVHVALMNSTVSDLDTLALDDIRGARALYPRDERYALDVQVTPSGAGTIAVTPAPGIDGLYPAGTLVTLTARPARRFRFNFWSGDEIASARRVRLLLVDNTQLTTNFSTNRAPVIVTQPRSQFAFSFEEVVLRARARGASSYQWQRDGVDIPDATNATLVLNFVGHESSGLYSVRAANAHGATHSKPARLVVDGY
jgi:hypothetical protein